MWEFFKKKIKKPKIIGEKVYTFGVQEICAIGDQYEYKVKAENKQEAFKKLVIYFFAKNKPSNINEAIKSTSGTVTQPQKDSFTYWGMPRWFAKRINGDVRGDNYDYQHELEKYARANCIELDTNN